MIEAAAACRNRLIAALPDDTLERWLPHLHVEEMRLGAEVYTSHADGDSVHFPTTSLVSLLHVMADGASAEIAVIGNDGVVGTSLLMGGRANAMYYVVQGAGSAYRLPADFLAREMKHGGAVMRLMLRAIQALISQMAQTAACNRHHRIEQQLCRWLLLSLDRTEGTELLMTQELISNMLGVRREGVAQAAANLQRMGAIRYVRGHIAVLDRKLLEACSCECYSALKQQLTDL